MNSATNLTTILSSLQSFLSKFLNKIKAMPKQSFAYWLCLFIFSYSSMFAMGRTSTKAFTYGLWLYITLCIIRKLSNKIFIPYLFFVCLVSAMYLPTALNYGQLSLGGVVSFYETNFAESKEYMALLGAKSFAYVIVYFLLFVVILALNKSVNISTNRRRIIWMFYGLVILPIIFPPVKHVINVVIDKKKVSIMSLQSIDYYPIRLVAEFIAFSHEYNQTRMALKESLQHKSTWSITDINQPYKNYVVVIGESMRRDYMSAYGYPINTTPFLASVNGTIFNNFVSASHNTNLALQRMLFQNRKAEDVVYPNTLITLANSANMQTYWLSNQGQYGHYDVLASSIAIKANEISYLKKEGHNSKNQSDWGLLTDFETVLSQPLKNKNRLIVLHLLGSHSVFCERLDDNYKIERVENFLNEKMSCYLSTLRQTDKLLEMLYGQLQNKNEPFSLMYFSDHGLAHKERAIKGVKLLHGADFKQNYEVPLMVLSSDDNQRTYINTPKSGYDLMTGITEWLGIQETFMANQPTFFSHQPNDASIRVYNGESVIEFETLVDDPAILPNNVSK